MRCYAAWHVPNPSNQHETSQKFTKESERYYTAKSDIDHAQFNQLAKKGSGKFRNVLMQPNGLGYDFVAEKSAGFFPP